MIRIHCVAFAAPVLVTGCAPIRQPQGFLGKVGRLEVGPHHKRPAVDLDAEEFLSPAESVLAETGSDQLVAVVNLCKALAGGWQPPGEQVAAR